MIKKRKHISLFSKTLIIIEGFAILSLVLLCAYKNKLPVVDKVYGETQVDVVLDAGHGGYDVGCMYEDYYEKDITLAMVKDIGKTLESNGYHVVYTRDSDEVAWASNEKEDLQYRTTISNASNAKLFISLHINSEDIYAGSYGYESWADTSDNTAVALSQNILNEVDTLQYSVNRGIQNEQVSPLYVISQNNIPAILFEVGFIGSPNDQQYLFYNTYQEKFSNKIAKGIMKTLEGIES